MDRKTVQNDEAFLRQISSPVDFKKDNIMEYVKACKDYCATHVCYALSPVQIGIPKRLIYIKNTKESMDNNFSSEYDDSVVYVNPVVISSKGKTKFLEACESVIRMEGDTIIYFAGEVERPYSIEVEYQDLNGNKQVKTIEGFEATVFSHEYDHLNGVLHTDKTNEVFEMKSQDMREYRSKHPYEIISIENKVL
ncbi:MAG: peptide deformylase [Bacilli bacterium]|nr:peptide deformylase [Bacilli bacterium]